MMVINDEQTCPRPDNIDPTLVCHGYRVSEWVTRNGREFVARCTGGHYVSHEEWIPAPWAISSAVMTAEAIVRNAARSMDEFDPNAPF